MSAGGEAGRERSIPGGDGGATGGVEDRDQSASGITWSQCRDSNPRPAVYETAALPLSYTGFSNLEGGQITQSVRERKRVLRHGNFEVSKGLRWRA